MPGTHTHTHTYTYTYTYTSTHTNTYTHTHTHTHKHTHTYTYTPDEKDMIAIDIPPRTCLADYMLSAPDTYIERHTSSDVKMHNWGRDMSSGTRSAKLLTRSFDAAGDGGVGRKAVGEESGGGGGRGGGEGGGGGEEGKRRMAGKRSKGEIDGRHGEDETHAIMDKKRQNANASAEAIGNSQHATTEKTSRHAHMRTRTHNDMTAREPRDAHRHRDEKTEVEKENVRPRSDFPPVFAVFCDL